MAPPVSLDTGPSGDYEFTFESYLDDSLRLEAVDVPYHFPNDPIENERIDEQYDVLGMAMDGRLHCAPFDRQNPPRKVLDIATGTGAWAIEMGDVYPEAQIIGTDLSPIQPAFVPPNVRFFVEDSDYPAEFDYIHTRATSGCFSDMKSQVIQRAFDHLKPGGWLECQEFSATLLSDDDTISPDWPFKWWSDDFISSSRNANRQTEVAGDLKDYLREVGFVDVHETVFKLPIGAWPKETRAKHLGMLWQRNILEGLSAFSLGFFNRFLGRSPEQIELSLVEVRRSLYDRKVHAYHKFFVVCGRKPETA
ncbi:S-adenosyl-L-methionine-dependent methyltransferase [Trichocladium antarcticum]|uniref:S-adenosyl-L-methionine-dependent methyltransferase n=1 Tax=Trichocladium antarcticum TaxID=1450529 RepID=A0AAN6URX9_9PEZI|nr:S-adenosyl-L-methionine-dependent methyltransferase [Trichocladium antarcticum]